PAHAAPRYPCSRHGRDHRRVSGAGADVRRRVWDESRRGHELRRQPARLHGGVAEPHPVAVVLDAEHARLLPHASAPWTSLAVWPSSPLERAIDEGGHGGE